MRPLNFAALFGRIPRTCLRPALPPHLVGGEGLAAPSQRGLDRCPLHKNPIPALGLSGLGLPGLRVPLLPLKEKFRPLKINLDRPHCITVTVAYRSTYVNSRDLRVFVLSFVRPPTRETTVFNISFMRLFVTEAS